MKFHASEDGTIKLGVRFAAAETVAISRTLYCTAGGTRTPIKFTVSPSDADVPVSVGSGTVEPQQSVIATAIARLGFDPRVASEATLESANLPPRPQYFAIGTAGYNTWLNAALRHVSRVVTKGFAYPGMTNQYTEGGGALYESQDAYNMQHGEAAAQSNGQGGFIGTGPLGTFGYNQAYFVVPDVTCDSLNQTCDVSIWPGIDDGDSKNINDPAGVNGAGLEANVFQAGVHLQVVNEGSTNQITISAIWHEYYPTEAEVDDYNVLPGEEVFCSIAKQIFGQAVSIRHYCQSTNGNNQTYSAANNWDVRSEFEGDQAEWIVERPSYNGELVNGIPNFAANQGGGIVMSGCTVQSGQTYINFADIANYWGLLQVNLVRGTTLRALASSYAVDSSTILVTYESAN